ncbi:Diacylglycerol kinase epsilon [Trichinella papuae]|uniref:Diacylglycerol kinase n=1 Tax=Trichinella papuae TaxID=268474 RepID=A0A0V1MCU4_9BILA|nr:Diacylglycerol kinase epsilon [Trichinella papuae]
MGVFLHVSLPEVDGLSGASFFDKTFSFMHYVFTQILRYSHAVLDCASMKAEVWTCPDIRYHHCYGVERHKRKRPCTEPADPQHTCTLGTQNLVYVAMTIFLILYETAKNCGLVFGVAVLTFYLIKILCTLLAESGSVHATTAQLKGHHWTLVDAFDAGYYCNVCNDSIYHGLECDYCGIVTDVSCMKKAEQSISCKSVAGVNKLEHLWVPGNLPVSSVCCVCYHNCGVGFGSNNLRCSWCQRTAHDACRHRISPNCDLSTFRQFVISPESILLETPNWRKRNTLIHNFSDNLHSWSPVVVFANRFSGSGEGYLVLKAFRRVLNPIQVCDLSQQSPKLGLELLNKIKDISKMVVLVAGGDGTVGWVFSAIEEISWPENRRPTVAVLPLGTGNDLSRVLGWGDGHSGIVDAAEILQQLSQATPVKLDRWLVSIVSPTKLGMKWSKSEYKMNNYLSVGVDALVTLNFHNRRHSLPRVLSGRFMNKFLFFTYGTKDVLERMCRNLHLHIELQLDDKPVELPELEGVVVLNIPCWGAGVKPWQMGKGGPPQLINDGLLEVGLSEPYRIGQAKKVQIRIKDCSLPMQVDGEPWRQGPSTILITHFGHASIFASEQAMMLQNATSESRELLTVYKALLETQVEINLLMLGGKKYIVIFCAKLKKAFSVDLYFKKKKAESTMSKVNCVYLSSEAYLVCLIHAYANEREEVMGLLIGYTDEETGCCHVTNTVQLKRLVKRRDRVEMTPETLSEAITYADNLNAMNDTLDESVRKKPVRVIGWYHSHPHITVYPSGVDNHTQCEYQNALDPMWIGIIFSVYNTDERSGVGRLNYLAFQSFEDGYYSVPVMIVPKLEPAIDSTVIERIGALTELCFAEESDAFDKAVQSFNFDDNLQQMNTLAYSHNASAYTTNVCSTIRGFVHPLLAYLTDRSRHSNYNLVADALNRSPNEDNLV